MGIEVLTTPFGAPAAACLRELVDAAQGDDPLAPVTILVPSNSVGVGARRSLASSGRDGRLGIAGIQVFTIQRFAELVGAAALATAGKRPATVPVVAAAVRAALAEVPGCFAAVAHHEATEEALVTAHQQLDELDEDALDAIAATSQRTRDLVAIHRAVRERLDDQWYGRAELLDAATASLPAHAAAFGATLLYLPERLEPAARRFITALSQHAHLSVLVGLTGADRADAQARELLTWLGVSDVPAVDTPAGDRVVAVSDADEEVRSAVEIVADAARAGTPFGRMAILHPTRDPYGRLLHEHLAAERIPVAGASARPLVGSSAGRFLLGVLGLPDHDYARGEVMGVLATAPLRHAGQRPRTARWEDLSREAGIVRGRDQWRERLDRLHAETIARRDAESEDWRRRRLGWQVETIEEFRAFIEPLLDRVEQARTATTWRSLSDEAARLLDDFVDDRTTRWPEVERRALDAVRTTVQKLAWLDELEATTSIDTFRRTLELELDTDLGRVGRIGDGVLVGPPGLAAGLDLDVVVVLGMAEGAAPGPVREDPLLQDEDRHAGRMEQAVERPHRLHRQILAAIAAGRAQRVLIQPRGDLRRSVERAPSRWLVDTANALGHDGRTLPLTATWLQDVPSFASRTNRAAAPATEQALRLALLMQGHADGLLGLEPVLASGLELTAARRSGTITRFDGDMRSVAHLLPRLADEQTRTSASRLQAFVACPHAYWARYILYVDEVEDPEEILRISATDRGSLIHDILERFILSQLESMPAPGEPWGEAARARLFEIADQRFAAWEQRGLTGHPSYWAADRTAIRSDLATWLDQDDDRRRRRNVTPVSAEQEFFGDEAVRVELGDGRSIHVQGAIDRVDEGPDHVLVIDYKTGRFSETSGYPDLSPEDPTAGGRQFQLPVYALAADPGDGRTVKAEYWFCTETGGWNTAGYPVDDMVLARYQQILGAVVDAHDHAVMPMRPTPPSTRRNWVDCAWCDPDGLGHNDRYRDWERKSGDHVTLGPLVRLFGLDVEANA